MFEMISNGTFRGVRCRAHLTSFGQRMSPRLCNPGKPQRTVKRSLVVSKFTSNSITSGGYPS